jgi:hypothetical protein
VGVGVGDGLGLGLRLEFGVGLDDALGVGEVPALGVAPFAAHPAATTATTSPTSAPRILDFPIMLHLPRPVPDNGRMTGSSGRRDAAWPRTFGSVAR